MTDKVAVFIDYQNCYKGARECFFTPGDPHMCGQVLPRRLGVKIRDHAAGQRELVAVHVYRGLPSSHHDPKGYGAADRQIAMWKQQALVVPVSRPLNYRDPARPKEKGIDVRIAIDMVMAIERGDCTIAVLFSDDTDLLPALEAIVERKGPQACEVATWSPSSRPSPRQPLRVSGGGHLIHRLNETDYRHVEDTTDYTLRRRRR